MAGEDIAQGVSRGLAEFNPITKMMGMAQGGGQQLMDLLMMLLQRQQQPQPPMAPQELPLRKRMTEY